MRAALYARYSSDLQNERSAEDQLVALRIVAAAKGLSIAREYADHGISGATLSNRPGAVSLLDGASRGQFDVVLTEALDRLSRDQEDIAHLFKRLNFHGVALETLSAGRVTSLHIGLEGTMNQMFLEELAKKTRRGLLAKVREGKSGGGLCYGYRIAEKGVFAIDDAQARVVLEIFGQYASGASARAIAASLNARAETGPRGGEWTAATINGDRRAQDGVLHNELYVGVRVFNRRRFRKHPETGRRSSVLNPQSEWIRMPAPELRILPDNLWRAVQARKNAMSELPRHMARRPTRLLSGLIYCGCCGSRMTIQGERYACTTRRERGTCPNGQYASAAIVEARVLEATREHLLTPDRLAKAAREYQEARQQEIAEASRDRVQIEAELGELERRIDRAADSYERGVFEVDELEKRVKPLKARRDELRGRLASLEQPPAYRIHPKAAEHYTALVESLASALEGEDALEAREAFRSLLEKVVLTPLEGRGQFALEVVGKLTALLGETNRAGVVSTVGAGTGFFGNTSSLVNYAA